MADASPFALEERMLASDITEYKSLLTGIAAPLRKAADAFERGELLDASEESRLSDMTTELMETRGRIAIGMEEIVFQVEWSASCWTVTMQQRANAGLSRPRRLRHMAAGAACLMIFMGHWALLAGMRECGPQAMPGKAIEESF